MTDTRAAAIGGLLTLPGAVIIPLLVIGIRPPFGPLDGYLAAEAARPGPDIVGSSIVIGAWALALVAFAANALALLRPARRGASDEPPPLLNAAVAAVSLCVALLFVGGIVADQYPCWIGVPNCD